MPQASTVVAIVGAAAFACLPGPASAAGLKVDYDISLAGLPLGQADLLGSIEGTRYQVQIQARLTGLAGAVTGGRGAGNASGSVAGGKPVPSSFSVVSRSSSDQRSVQMGLKDGNVSRVDIVPPLEDKPDRVPLADGHKRGVVDPVSAVVMPVAGNGDLLSPANCNRTLPIFDGATRFNVVLSYGATQAVQRPGYDGPVLVCNARYVPIAGHRSERPGTKFMQDNREMQVWLAPVAGTRVLLPVRIAVQTMIGMSVIEASSWSLNPGGERRARAE